MTVTTAAPLPLKRSDSAKPLISIPFLLLRGFSTAAIVVTALIQIYVFARVMSAEQFSIFILVGAVGYSLWLIDLGVIKFLFVRVRAAHLSGRRGAALRGQCTAVVALYAAVTLAGTVVCFAVLAALPKISVPEAVNYALFFLFTALNLSWYALRNLSIAVDDFVYFESIEAARRAASIGVMLAMLAGLPVLAFLLVVNLLWAVAIAVAVVRLHHLHSLSRDWRGAMRLLWPFYRDNRRDLLHTGTSSTSDFYIEHVPYLIVPFAFGLGAPIVILDAIFKFVRGANLYYHAVSDLVLPRQTSAFAERDASAMVKATLLATLLAALPTAAVAAGLIFAADAFFKLLLGPAATMPADATWIIIALLFGTLVQVLAHSLLIHSGFFAHTARAMGATAIAVTLVPALALAGSATIVGYLDLYAAAFVGGALLHVAYALYGPLRTARGK